MHSIHVLFLLFLKPTDHPIRIPTRIKKMPAYAALIYLLHHEYGFLASNLLHLSDTDRSQQGWIYSIGMSATLVHH